MNSIRFYVFSVPRANQTILFITCIALISILILHYSWAHSNISNVLCTTLSSSEKPSLTKHSIFSKIQMVSSDTFTYTLDSECQLDRNDSTSVIRKKAFNNIFETGLWDRVDSRSGLGSSLAGAYDWIKNLNILFKHYSIRSIADIPCGDTYWQFTLREINTIKELYFGGDISTSVIKQNQKLYGSKHLNKLFQYWDLVNCPIPTYTFKNSTHEIKGNQFDLIIVRDAIQHMNIRHGLKAVRNVINSGAKFFALSSYPPNGKSSSSHTRSIGTNETLPFMPVECEKKNYCILGKIKDGQVYHNNINCYPFNFPLNKAILVKPSHEQFPMEYDEMHIYKIDEELKQIVKQYDNACY